MYLYGYIGGKPLVLYLVKVVGTTEGKGQWWWGRGPIGDETEDINNGKELEVYLL